MSSRNRSSQVLPTKDIELALREVIDAYKGLPSKKILAALETMIDIVEYETGSGAEPKESEDGNDNDPRGSDDDDRGPAAA